MDSQIAHLEMLKLLVWQEWGIQRGEIGNVGILK